MRMVHSFVGLFFVLLALLVGGIAAAAAATSSVAAAGQVTRIQSKEKNAFDVFVATIRNARHHLAAAAVARSVSIFTMYPVDTIKVSMGMMDSDQYIFDSLLES